MASAKHMQIHRQNENLATVSVFEISKEKLWMRQRNGVYVLDVEVKQFKQAFGRPGR